MRASLTKVNFHVELAIQEDLRQRVSVPTIKWMSMQETKQLAPIPYT